MTDQQSSSPGERNAEQAITALKRGSYLLKYGRRGKPKFCHFQLSKDETTIIWYPGRKEKQLRLSQVSRIIPGQRTGTFKRYPQPEKEYQSFSLIYDKGSLDVVGALTHRTQFLAAELERTSDQLEEAMEFVQDEAEKNNAAKEVIKCLVRQLKAMAVRLPQGSSCRATDPFADNMSHVLSTAST